MENDEITDEIEVTQTDDQELELDESSEEQTDSESSTPESDELAKAQAEANKWRRIAQKNAKVQETKTPVPTAKASPTVDIDERILKANGMNEDLLKELKIVARARGISLIDAQNDYLFVAAKEKFDRDEKSRLASLSSSRGSGQSKPKVGLDTPGLSREDHKKLIESRL